MEVEEGELTMGKRALMAGTVRWQVASQSAPRSSSEKATTPGWVSVSQPAP